VTVIKKLDLLTAKEAVLLVNMSSRDFLRSQNQWVPRIQDELDTPYPKYPDAEEQALMDARVARRRRIEAGLETEEDLDAEAADEELEKNTTALLKEVRAKKKGVASR
jgi:hypothetical protein